MSNVVRDTIKKSRDKFLGILIGKIDTLDSRVQQIQLSQDEVKHRQAEVHQAQLEILKIQTELRDKTVNSRTLVLSDSEMVTKIFSGLKIYLDPRDIAVAHHMALDAIWEYQITAAWQSVVKPTDTVLDIGANFGYFGALAAQKTDKSNSRVILFEANPNLVPYIEKTLSVNWLNEQSIVENLAVADKTGKVTLNVLKDYIGSSSVHTLEHSKSYMQKKMRLELDTAITVEATTIDAYCDKHKIKTVDLVKMDIEGYEDKAYAGMRKIIHSSPNATLFVEFTKDSYSDPKLFYTQMLEDFGFVYLINENGQLITPKRNDYETVIGNPEDWVMPVFSKNKSLGNLLK